MNKITQWYSISIAHFHNAMLNIFLNKKLKKLTTNMNAMMIISPFYMINNNTIVIHMKIG